MSTETKFSYKNFAGSTVICTINDCPLDPVSINYVDTGIVGKATDGTVVARPRYTSMYKLYTLNFSYVDKASYDALSTMESVVHTWTSFTWIADGYINTANRSVYLAEKINYQAHKGTLWSFTIKLLGT